MKKKEKNICEVVLTFHGDATFHGVTMAYENYGFWVLVFW